jgi:hypothetical protein
MINRKRSQKEVDILLGDEKNFIENSKLGPMKTYLIKDVLISLLV